MIFGYSISLSDDLSLFKKIFFFVFNNLDFKYHSINFDGFLSSVSFSI